MESEPGRVLSKVLTTDELSCISPEVTKKLENHFEEQFEKFLIAKAKYETAHSNHERIKENSEKHIQELTTKNQEYEVKFDLYQQNVDELSQQLNLTREEVLRLQEAGKRYDAETAALRRERSDAVHERDSFNKLLARRRMEIEGLQSDYKALQAQLQSAIASKCDAILKMGDVQSKEANLDFKEKRLEQERNMLNSTIQTLQGDLNRYMSENQSIRRENTVRTLTLETKLNERSEELKSANSTIAHLNEINASLITKSEELATKLNVQNQEVTKVIESYRKQLHSQETLVQLYKDGDEDKTAEIKELTDAIHEIKILLKDATDQYGEMETKMKQSELNHSKEIEDRDAEIQSLKYEIKHANDLLEVSKNENLEKYVEKMAPTAALTSRFTKSNMSLTQIYSMYVKEHEEHELLKREFNVLEMASKKICLELEENAPSLHKERLEYQQAIEGNKQLNDQMELKMAECVEAKDQLRLALSKIQHQENELKTKKKLEADLSRQMCTLLKEIECARGFYNENTQELVPTDIDPQDLISKKLVTYRNIEELQTNNLKLILVVRDLTEKVEEMEDVQVREGQATFEAKLSQYKTKLEEYKEEREYQFSMLQCCTRQKDRYKKLYATLARKCGLKEPVDITEGDSVIGAAGDSMMMDGVEDEANNGSTAPSSIISNDDLAAKDKRIIELEQLIADLKTKLKELKDEYNEYKKEKLTNEKMMNEQFDSMRTELRDTTMKNCKISSDLEFSNEQIKMQQKNTAMHKKQISTLEDRNKIYESSIIKHEQTITMLRDEILAIQQRQIAYENKIGNLKAHNRIISESETHLKLERDSLQRERNSQNLVLQNLEEIKNSMERFETEGKQRVEERLDEARRECNALRRRLQEEQDRFRDSGIHLERQTEHAKKLMVEEKQAADKLREELTEYREELIKKNQEIETYSKKLQESLTPNKFDNPVTQANKKVKEMQSQLNERNLKIEQLTSDLEDSRKHGQHYCKISETLEQEFQTLNTEHSEFREKAKAELEQLRKSEADYKTRVSELETEIQLQISTAQVDHGDASTQLKKAQTDLRDALQKLNENNREIRDLREYCNSQNSSLQSAELKYNNQMMAHSDDIRTMTTMKEELNKLREQVSKIELARDEALAKLEQYSSRFDTEQSSVSAEKEEYERRIKDLDQQNTALLEQVQMFSHQLSVSQSLNNSISGNVDANASGSESSTLLNRSITEEDLVKKDSNMLQIVNYLRKEKDIAIAKLDLMHNENLRLQTEYSVLQKKYNEANEQLEKERSQSDVGIVTATKHEDILRRIETLDAVTDSNRILREERNNLILQVDELRSRVRQVEDDLFPLQEKNRELTSKSEEVATENTALRNEAHRWRLRANQLLEPKKQNQNSEEFKRLQNERECLAKMLTTEKEKISKLTEELKSSKSDVLKSDVELANLSKQVLQMTQEKKLLDNELLIAKQAHQRLTSEVLDMKNSISTKEDDMKKLTDDIASKEEQLTEAKSKEMQIRKIAKKYKDSYFELKKQVDDSVATGENIAKIDVGNGDGPSTAVSAVDAKMVALEKNFNDRINELNLQIAAKQEDNNTLLLENKVLREKLEKEEFNRTVLKEAKNRIGILNEAKNVANRELAACKAQLQVMEQSQSEISGSLKLQYEARITRLEKDLSDLEKERQESLSRVSSENDTLKLRLNSIIQRQQGSKPSTSSGVGGEKSSSESQPRTANVKPMAGPSGQQSATVTPWRGGDTPLASIRPMPVQNSRTAAVLPTNVAAVQGSSSVAATALVPPQQQVHTTGGSSGSSASASSNAGEAMSSSPTSSHTDYMPATSSATVAIVTAAVPPMGAAASSAESSHEAESGNQGDSSVASGTGNSSSTSSSGAQQQQQAVALVSPRVETATPNLAPPPQPANQQPDQNQAPSTSGGTSSSSSSTSSSSSSSTSSTATAVPSTSNSGGSSGAVAMSTHHQASSSNTVTTTQAGHKRPRGDIDGDSSTEAGEVVDKQPKGSQTKRTRLQQPTTVGEVFQGVSESGLDVEYQVPTSSQRDQEDDIIVVDSEEDDDEESTGLPDEGTAEADDGPFEDDNNDAYEMMEVEQEMANFHEGDGPDIDEDNVPSYINEVGGDESREANNDAGSSGAPGTSGHSAVQNVELQSREVQQIQTISSGSEATQSNWRQSSRQQQQQSSQQHLLMSYEETGDDSIVPSTPTLCVPRRVDGFSEAVSSPHPQVPGRFAFVPEAATASGSGTVARSLHDGMDDTRVDLSQMDETKVVAAPLVLIQSSPESFITFGESSSQLDTNPISIAEEASDSSIQEPVAGPSHMGESMLPAIIIIGVPDEVAPNDEHVDDDDNEEENASTSDAMPTDGSDHNESLEMIEDGEGTDGVTSEGEKAQAGSSEAAELEEGREAEASTSTINTRSRAVRGNNRRGNRAVRRPTPIIWQQEERRQRGGAHARDGGSPGRGNYQQQLMQHPRGTRGRRNNRRPFNSY